MTLSEPIAPTVFNSDLQGPLHTSHCLQATQPLAERCVDPAAVAESCLWGKYSVQD